jgi:hypothetical protein
VFVRLADDAPNAIRADVQPDCLNGIIHIS